MLYKQRKHTILRVHTAQDLAHKLTRNAWVTCQGFAYGGFLYLNDSSGPDGGQEYAVLREAPNADGTHDVIESITFSWCSEAEALAYIEQITRDDANHVFSRVPVLQHGDGYCAWCA